MVSAESESTSWRRSVPAALSLRLATVAMTMYSCPSWSYSGGQHRPAAPLGEPDLLQRPDLVVPPGHHLEHDRVVPLGEHAEDRLARGDDGIDLGRPGLGVGGEVVEFRAHLLLRPRPLLGDQRGIEAAVPDLPGQVADGRMAQLGGGHQLVDDLPVAVAGLLGQRRRVAQPPPQQLRHHRHVQRRAAVGQEYLVESGLQAG